MKGTPAILFSYDTVVISLDREAGIGLLLNDLPLHEWDSRLWIKRFKLPGGSLVSRLLTLTITSAMENGDVVHTLRKQTACRRLQQLAGGRCHV